MNNIKLGKMFANPSLLFSHEIQRLQNIDNVSSFEMLLCFRKKTSIDTKCTGYKISNTQICEALFTVSVNAVCGDMWS